MSESELEKLIANYEPPKPEPKPVLVEAPKPFTTTETLFNLCVAMYDEMAKRSVNGLYEGSVYSIVRDLNLPQSYQTRMSRQLRNLGCIEQIEPGRAGKPGLYRLVSRPDRSTWTNRYDSPLTPERRAAILTDVSKRVETLEERLSGLDIKRAFVELAQEIETIKRDVTTLQNVIQAQSEYARKLNNQ